MNITDRTHTPLNVSDEAFRLLNAARLPARLTYEQAAPLLGFPIHNIPVLVKAKLLKPLGRPPSNNAVKFLSADNVGACMGDPAWLNRATDAVYNHWSEQNKNRRKNALVSDSSDN